QDHTLLGNSECGLQLTSRARWQEGNAVRDDVHAVAGDAVGSVQQPRGRFAHDDQPGGTLRHLPDDRLLRRGRLPQHGVKGDEGWNPQRGQQLQHVGSVIPAVDAVLMLDRDELDAAVVDELRGTRIVPLDALTYLVLDLGGALVFTTGCRVGYGDPDGGTILIRFRGCCRKIPRKRSNPTVTGYIRADERDPELGFRRRDHGALLLGRLPRAIDADEHGSATLQTRNDVSRRHPMARRWT